MATLFDQSSDIFVKGRPIGLSTRAPEIFHDYAISRDTAISIMPSMEDLIADPTFRRSVRETLGGMTLVDIKVRGEDGAVLVKDPSSPDSDYEEVDFHARAAVRDVSKRTQAAYRRFIGSPSSSRETYPRRVKSAVYDHSAPTARSLSYHHVPSPTVRPEFYESRIHDLESENRKLQHSLSQSEEARRGLESKLKAADQELSRLRPENAQLRRDLQKARQELSDIARAVQGGRQSEETLPQLAERYHVTIGRLERELGTALDANRSLQQIIQGIRKELPEAPERDADLPGAVAALRIAKEEAEQARLLLHEELEALKLQHSEKVAILDRIGVVLDKKGEPHENIPDLVRALGSENRQLKEKIAQHVAAQSRLGEILVRVGELTGERIETMEDLPGAVERALGRVEKRAETANLRADSLQERVTELTEELRETKRAHKEEIASKQEAIRKLEVRATHAEAELEGQGEHVLDLESQADVLRQECGKLARALRETKKQHAEEVSGLKRELQSAQHDLAQERETTAALRKEVSALKEAARETEQRHREALREQEVAHQREITPLRERLEEVTHLNGEQAKRIAALEKDLEAAREATRESDQRRQRELREQEEAHQDVLAPLKARLERAELALSEATSTTESQQASIRALTKEVADLKVSLEERAQISSEELQRLREESEQLRSLLGQIDDIARKVPIEREARSLAEELEAVQQGPQYDKLPGEVKEVITALLKEIRDLKAKDLAVREKEATIEDLQSQLLEQGSRSSEAQAALKAEIESLHADLLQVRNDAFDLGQKQAGLIGTLRETLRRERQATAKEHASKLEKINELEEELRKAERTIRTLQHTIKQQGIKLEGETERADHYQKLSEELSEKKKELRGLIKGLRKTLAEMEADRNSWQEESGYYETHYSSLRKEHTELQERCGKLEEEVAQLRQILATTFSVEPTLNVHQFREARSALQGRIFDLEQTIEVLSDKVVRVEKSKARVEKRQELTAQERDAALKQASESERLRRLEEQGRHSAEHSRDRLSEELEGAHSLARSQTKQLDANLRQIKDLRAENTELREALEAHRHSSAEQEEILQRAIAQKAEELQRLQEAEEARRLHELDEQQRQELRAADASEIMGEIARGMEGSGLKFEDVTGSKMPPWIKEYLQSMKTGSLPKRHAQTAASEISQLNEKPYPLADLKLFTGFFQVTDHVSGLRGSKAFLQLKANNAILAQLNPETQQEAIKRIKAQNTAIIRGLLNGFFSKVNEVAGTSSGLSRFRNIGMQLWIWNTIFHGLSTEFYDGTDDGTEAAKSFKKTRVKTINLANAEKMRTTVHDLHSRFQEMMRPFVTA